VIFFNGYCFEISGDTFLSEGIQYQGPDIGPVHGIRMNFTLTGGAPSVSADLSISIAGQFITDTLNLTNGTTFFYELDENSGFFDGTQNLTFSDYITLIPYGDGYDTVILCQIEVLVPQT